MEQLEKEHSLLGIDQFLEGCEVEQKARNLAICIFGYFGDKDPSEMAKYVAINTSYMLTLGLYWTFGLNRNGQQFLRMGGKEWEVEAKLSFEPNVWADVVLKRFPED